MIKTKNMYTIPIYPSFVEFEIKSLKAVTKTCEWVGFKISNILEINISR